MRRNLIYFVDLEMAEKKQKYCENKKSQKIAVIRATKDLKSNAQNYVTDIFEVFFIDIFFAKQNGQRHEDFEVKLHVVKLE